MKQLAKLVTLLSLTFVLLVPFVSAAATSSSKSSASKACCSTEAVVLRDTMRKLWMEHVFYTKSYIVSAADGLADKDKVLARLLQNQQDIGDAVKPYYGEAAGNKLAELLKE